MLEMLTTSLRIGVSHTGVALLKTEHWPRPRTRFIAELPLAKGFSDFPTQLAALLQSLPKPGVRTGTAVTVVLADDLLRYFMVTPPANAASVRDCRVAAMMRFQMLYDETPSQWDLNGDWDARQAFLACAVPLSLIDMLRSGLRQTRLCVLAILPQFVAVANRARKNLPSGSWLAVLHESSLTLGASDGGRLCAVRRMPLSASDGIPDNVLAEQVEREALRLGLAMPKQVALHTSHPDHWAAQQIGDLSLHRLNARAEFERDGITSANAALAWTGLHAPARPVARAGVQA
jgi:hypothetical protein